MACDFDFKGKAGNAQPSSEFIRLAATTEEERQQH